MARTAAADRFHVPLDLRLLIGAIAALVAVLLAVSLVVYYSAKAGHMLDASMQRLDTTTQLGR